MWSTEGSAAFSQCSSISIKQHKAWHILYVIEEYLEKPNIIYFKYKV